MRKTILWCLMLIMMVASLGLGGCGGGDKKPAGEAPKPTTQPAKQESVGDLLAKGGKHPGLTYDYVMTMKEMKMTGKVWIAGKKMKTETTAQNQKMIMIVDGDANVMYNYMPDQQRIMKMAFDPKTASKGPDQYSREADAGKAKVVESATVDGVKCQVLLIENADNKIQTKMWVREDYGIPVRVEVNEPTGDKMVMEYKNLKVGAVPAETFQLPAGVPVTDMSEMMKNLPKK